MDYSGNVDSGPKTQFPSPTTPGTSNASDYEQPAYEILAGGTRTSGLVASLRLRDGQNIAFSYDNLSRMTLKNVPNIVYAEHDVSYAWDNFGRPTLISGTNGHSVGFAHDALGRVTGETNNYGTRSLQYDLAGRLTRMSWPDAVSVVARSQSFRFRYAAETV